MALAGGVLLALAAFGFELLTSRLPGHTTVAVAADGFASAVVCAGVGSAIGALCSPPLVRRLAYGVLAMGFAVVAALAAGVSPASAAVRGVMSPANAGLRLPLQPAAIAAALVIATWALSILAASRRTGS